MKNREKYRDEILNSALSGNVEEYCEFAKKNVLPNLTDCTNGGCNELHSCGLCRTIFDFWLDEEYEEPPKQEVNWYHVPVDTLVRVRDRLNEDWKLAFFKGFYPHKQFKFATWTNAETSKTGYDYEVWMFCELVEDEDNGSN